MCGIAGAVWNAGATPLPFSVLERMTTSLAHRGPDDAGYYHSLAAPRGAGRQGISSQPTGLPEPVATPVTAQGGSGAALGHRRLSIIDLAGGHQPLCNEDGTVWIVFNGEIYNYRELQPDLIARGHHFHTASDTETIVHLYEEYGPACVDRLRGMFAFAIWDVRRERLFLARDRLGKKPLVLRHTSTGLFFASELKALLQVPGAPRDINPQSIDAYLTYQYVPHPDSILSGYEKLPPGHRALYAAGQLQVEEYWKPDFSRAGVPGTFPTSVEAARRQLRETLTEAVRLRMRSDVPLGAFLSGGIDSTIIAGLMQRLSRRPVQTFSIGFPVRQFDERSYARLAAEHLHTEHHEQLVEPQALEILPKLIWHYDEPFADSSAIPTMYLAQMTRREVTVALSGDGGDELFAGYDRYRAVRLAEKFDKLPACARKLLAAPFWQRIPASVRQKSRRRRIKRLLAALGLPPERRYLTWVSIFDADRRRGLYTDEFAMQLGGTDSADFLLEAYRACQNRDFVTRTTCTDVLTYLPCDILNKVDIASMAYGLEARCPFLDQEVTQFAARLPIEWKLHRGRGKQILIDTFADLLPPKIQHRAKMGFGVPLDHWFRNELQPLLQEVLLDSRCLNRGWFRPEVVRQLVTEHTQGKWDHSYRLWSLLVLELWQQTFIDPAVPPSAPAGVAAHLPA